MNSWVRFGRVARPHGVHGEVRVVPDDADFVLPAALKRVRLAPGEGGSASPAGLHCEAEKLLELQGARVVHEAWLMRFSGVETRTAAEGLRGAVLELETALLPPPGVGEYYFYELAGAEVRAALTGELLGVARAVVSSGGQPLLVLEGAAGERLLPLGGDVVERFDRLHHHLLVRVPAGLWD